MRGQRADPIEGASVSRRRGAPGAVSVVGGERGEGILQQAPCKISFMEHCRATGGHEFVDMLAFARALRCVGAPLR
jgi:hypothetical protein